ncbi:hypothetical protein OHR86_12160 [Streptomyces sp. NBC_00441]|uniref:hypothetical protein n=1 Tax=Streptomyces sp. NBC_00441 TaxID=2975742 RepID=UPI002E29F7EB|nr:hypothetical protein [Streptomyces sp. NBC_00441]
MPTADGGVSFHLPLSRYSFSAEESALISQAERIVTEQCMARFHLGYESAGTDSSGRGPDRRYGITSATEAKESGYHMPRPPVRDSPRLSEREILVLMGSLHPEQGSPRKESVEVSGKRVPVPSGGCTGEASRSVLGTSQQSDAAAAAQEISLLSFKESRTDAKVVSAFKRWSVCMRKEGFDYASPLDPAEDFTEGESASVTEKRAALTDVECKEKVGLVAVWEGVESAIQEGKMKKHATELADLERAHAAQMKTVHAIIAKNSGH